MSSRCGHPLHPFKAWPTAARSSSIEICPSWFASPNSHAVTSAFPRAMLTMVSNSFIVTVPSSLQSPVQGGATLVGVNVGEAFGVLLGVGVTDGVCVTVGEFADDGVAVGVNVGVGGSGSQTETVQTRELRSTLTAEALLALTRAELSTRTPPGTVG